MKAAAASIRATTDDAIAFVGASARPEAGAVPASAGATPGRTRRRGSVRDLALWSRQLCVLIRSGTPLAQALTAIEQQTREGTWRGVLAELRQAVEEGSALSAAMARRPDRFDQVTRSLVAAGESSGQLGPMLDRVAKLIRQQLRTQRALLGALLYPLILMTVGVVVTLVMLLGVIPRFAELFDSLNAALPPTTKLLMHASELFRSFWWAVLIAIAALVAGTRLFITSEGGRRVIDIWLLRIPCLGTTLRSLATARIARLLGVMLESRVPLLEALRLTRGSASNSLYTELMDKAVDSASRGEPVSAVFSRTPLIIPAVAEAIRHGEKNGQVGPIMTDMADFLDEENEVIIRSAVSILEPMILVVLGALVGFIALSLFIPLFDLAGSGGGAR